MMKSVARGLLLVFIAVGVVSAARADRVTVTKRGDRYVLRVKAGIGGRAAHDTRRICDFHLILHNGVIVSHRSPEGWHGSHQGGEVDWETETACIPLGKGLSGFIIKISDATGMADWVTTDSQGETIQFGVINLNGPSAY